MLNDLKELEKFFKICRKQGVTEITFEGISAKFGDLPSKLSSESQEEENSTENINPDDLIYYAVSNAAG